MLYEVISKALSLVAPVKSSSFSGVSVAIMLRLFLLLVKFVLYAVLCDDLRLLKPLNMIESPASAGSSVSTRSPEATVHVIVSKIDI